MRVAILNRAPSAYPGGDVLSIEDLIEALRPLGVEATYVHGHWTPEDLKPFDLVHIKHMNFSWSWFNFEQTWMSKKPYVLQPMFYPRFDLGMDKSQMEIAIERAEVVCPQSNRELGEIVQRVCVPKKVMTIPNGTHERFMGTDGGERSGVLCVSARGPSDKNAPVVEDVCKKLGLPFTCAVDLSQDDLAALYRRSKVFVNASDSERMSRTVGEALCTGCRVLSHEGNWGNEWYSVESLDVTESLSDALEIWLEWAYHSREWDYTPNTLARLLTWERSARMWKAAYEWALEGRA